MWSCRHLWSEGRFDVRSCLSPERLRNPHPHPPLKGEGEGGGSSSQALLHEDAHRHGLIGAEGPDIVKARGAIKRCRFGLFDAGLKTQQRQALAQSDRFNMFQKLTPDALAAQARIDEHALDFG